MFTGSDTAFVLHPLSKQAPAPKWDLPDEAQAVEMEVLCLSSDVINLVNF